MATINYDPRNWSGKTFAGGMREGKAIRLAHQMKEDDQRLKHEAAARQERQMALQEEQFKYNQEQQRLESVRQAESDRQAKVAAEQASEKHESAQRTELFDVAEGFIESGDLPSINESWERINPDGAPFTEEDLPRLAEELKGRAPEAKLTPFETEIGGLVERGTITQEEGDALILKRLKKEATPTTTTAKITGPQRLAGGFSVRIENANTIIDELSGDMVGVLDKVTGSMVWPEMFKSDDRQRFEQAERNFINATLRRESGAAIAPSEFESAKMQYIPQPGNDEGVLAQKKRNRETIGHALRLEAGPAYDELRASLPPTHVSYNGKKVQIGSIIESPSGKRGRVNADGSVTVVE